MRGPLLAGQRTMASVANRLADGAAEDWFIAMGTSMRPTVRAVQRVHLRPVRATETLLDEVVLVRVDGRWWLHRVVEERSSRVLVAGDNGMVNGWTPRSEVAGVLTRPRSRRRELWRSWIRSLTGSPSWLRSGQPHDAGRHGFVRHWSAVPLVTIDRYQSVA